MNRPLRPILFPLLIALASVLCFTAQARAQRVLDRSEVKQLNGVGVDEHLGGHVPLEAVFTNQDGELVKLGTYFDGQTPVILVMVYYECPVVCPVVLSQLTASLNKLDYVAGKDFRLLVVSFDPDESTTMALGKRIEFLGEYNKGNTPEALRGIAYHTGDVANIRDLTTSIGFNFSPTNNGEYSHPVSLMILSPKGKVTRYMYGFDYPPQELKLSLLDASEGKIAQSLGDRLLHFCYRLDPKAGTYSLQAFRVMQIGAVLTMVLIAVGLTMLFMGDRVRRRINQARLQSEPGHDPAVEAHSQPGGTTPGASISARSPKTPSGPHAGAKTGHVS